MLSVVLRPPPAPPALCCGAGCLLGPPPSRYSMADRTVLHTCAVSYAHAFHRLFSLALWLLCLSHTREPWEVTPFTERSLTTASNTEHQQRNPCISSHFLFIHSHFPRREKRRENVSPCEGCMVTLRPSFQLDHSHSISGLHCVK